MSKPKPKDKGDPTAVLYEQLETQKRELLEQSFTIRKLQDRIASMSQQTHEVVSTRDYTTRKHQEEVERQRIIIENHEHTIRNMRTKNSDLEFAQLTLEAKVRYLYREVKEQYMIRNRELDETKRVLHNDLGKMEMQLKDYQFYMAERDGLQADNESLRRKLDDEKDARTRQVADKEREKVQATDKLRDDMLTKIKNLNADLLSLRKEQLDTTTRLTVLQNHQLTNELYFQSKQSEQLLQDNEHLTRKAQTLQQELDVHRDMEQYLARRALYSKGIIRKLTARIAELYSELATYGVATKKLPPNHSDQNAGETKDTEKLEVIRSLDEELQTRTKYQLEAQSKLRLVEQYAQKMAQRLQLLEQNADTLFVILSKYLNDLLDGTAYANFYGVSYDLRQLRKRKPYLWTADYTRIIVRLLLEQVGNRLNRKALGMPPINKGSLIVVDDDDDMNDTRLPRLSEHTSASRINFSLGSKGEGASRMAPKVVTGEIRQWGRTVHTNSVGNFTRKFKLPAT